MKVEGAILLSHKALLEDSQQSLNSFELSSSGVHAASACRAGLHWTMSCQ